MKRSYSGILAGVLLVIAVLFWVSRLESPHQVAPPAREQVRGSKSDDEVRTVEPRPQDAAPAPAVEQMPTNLREAALEAIHDSAITYDPAQLRVIQPYLFHSDPELRHSAREAMLVLGDAAASLMLRDAAKRAASTREALQFEEAADFLDLPPRRFERVAPGAGQASRKPLKRR